MSKLKLGDKAPDFKLPGVDGQTHILHDYADKNALVVIFSCNHCPYVQAWEDRIINIQSNYMGDGIQLIAISTNDTAEYPADSFSEMIKRSSQKGFNFPYLYDESQTIAKAYGAERTPEVFVFDNTQKLAYHGAIDDNYEDPASVKEHYLRNALDAIISNATPSVPETPPIGCTIKWK